MGIRGVAWAVFLGGLPFAHFVFKPLDIWHGQALWAQIWILVIFGISFFENSRIRINKPLGAWVLWISLFSMWIWLQGLKQEKLYNFSLLMPVMHNLFIVLFYAVAQNMTKRQTQNALLWVSRAAVLVLIYCLIQRAGLDQFFVDIDTFKQRNRLQGTIGNPSHLAAYIAMVIPLLWYHRWKLAVLLGIAVLVMTKSVSGWIACAASLAWCAWFWNRKVLIPIGIACAGAVAYAVFDPVFLNPHGRLEVWAQFWEMFRNTAITGRGPGFVMMLSQGITDPSNPLWHWRHVHCEYFQVALECGLIGLSIIVWALSDMWKKIICNIAKREIVAFGGVMLAFMVISLVNFPAHLWMLGSLALLAYSRVYAISEE